MLLNEYQTGAVATAIYPGELSYPTIGLCGEIGELIEALDESVDDLTYRQKAKHYRRIRREIGDVIWYVANVANDCGLTLEEVIGSVGFPISSELWSVDGLIREFPKATGKVAENVKKAIRDNAGLLTVERRDSVRTALNYVVTLLSRTCNLYGVTLEECAILNNVKLNSRKDRGVLKGDGDDR